MKLFIICMIILFLPVNGFSQAREHIPIKDRGKQVTRIKAELNKYINRIKGQVRSDIAQGKFNGALPGDENGYYEVLFSFPKSRNLQSERDVYALGLVNELNVECAALVSRLATLTGYLWFSKVSIQDEPDDSDLQITLHLQARKVG